jgi:hypothetical protein
VKLPFAVLPAVPRWLTSHWPWEETYLETIFRAGFSEVTVISEFPYEAPGMDERLRGKILSVKVRAFKGP